MGMRITLHRSGMLRTVVGLMLLIGLTACSSGGQPTEGACEAVSPGEFQEECLDSGTGEGPMDNN
jgi:hypothetical protein